MDPPATSQAQAAETLHSCAQCGRAFVPGAVARVEDRYFCRLCFEALEATVRQHFEELGRGIDRQRAALYGLFATAVSVAAMHYAALSFGRPLEILALGAGWLIANAVVRGGRGRRGPFLQWLSAGLTALSVFLAQVSFAHWALLKTLDGSEQAPAWEAALPAAIRSLSPFALAIIAFAVYQAFKMPALPKLAPRTHGR